MPQNNSIKGFVSIILALWLWSMPMTFGFNQRAVNWNGWICGLLLFIFGVLWIKQPRPWFSWAICFVGLWLQLAPLLFWYVDPSAYISDTMIGVIAIVVSVLIPERPYGPERANHTPQGWSYNPSAWIQRLPIVGLALICWFISRYLGAYQMGYIHRMWDPVFGDGTLMVINSDISKAWPVSDAGLGAFSYTIEALMGCQGDTKRWCSSPWAVILFGILVVPLGVISIILIILQPVAVGAWCFLCLVTAICMLIMVALTVDEVAACIQYLNQVRNSGRSFWHVFWHGGKPFGESNKIRTKPYPLSMMHRGINFPWNLGLSTLLGLWLIVSPYIFNTRSNLANSDFITGALVISFSVIAFAEVTRATRYINVLFGMWLFAAPWILTGAGLAPHWNDHIVGLFLILLAYRRGFIDERYGTLTRKIG